MKNLVYRVVTTTIVCVAAYAGVSLYQRKIEGREGELIGKGKSKVKNLFKKEES